MLPGRLSEADTRNIIETALARIGQRRFPYTLIYANESHGILVVAVAHHKRQPFYWRKRLKTVL